MKMTKLKLLSAVALLASAVSYSAMAQGPAPAMKRPHGVFSETYNPGAQNLSREREARNDLSGPLCTPGSAVMGEDGQTYTCQ
jgi:hypothetical protein